MSVVSNRAALGSLLGSSKRVNSTPSEHKLIGSKQTPTSKNNSAGRTAGELAGFAAMEEGSV